MPRHVLTIRDLGESTCWLLVHQAIGIPDAKLRTDFMTERVAVLIFAQHSLPERLCVTAAVRQMGGFTVYEGEQQGAWRVELNEYQEHLMPIFGYYMDCLYAYGLPVSTWDMRAANVNFPVINAGSPDAHPAHALADIACMLRSSRYLQGVTAGWLGCANGTLHSIIEATAWFPFSLRVALPPHVDPAPLQAMVDRLKTPVTFMDTPEEAVKGVNFVFVGCRGGMSGEDIGPWRLDAELMSKADPDARLLLSASPVEAIPVDRKVLSSPTSQLVRQSEYRLRVHKRILHWVFQDGESPA
ncbi:ornithine carbamoyltransferase [uncultured Desulfovibrio sp.]|uniref:ornithine carbamoyltransferase n=1 Tax=uncultured Desulfovibrio sp. TaxID=167968 RepID=UPI00263488F1|nr:ornithine carbamoyltransferase [uncultured Desulfovibrio sp.]